MIITLSPAKVLDFESPVSIEKSTRPLFKSETKELSTLLKDYSAQDIAGMMKINPKQAIDVYQYFQSFDMSRTREKQAAMAYNGMVFLGLAAKSLASEDFEFAQKHLIIFSGLYGALRPLDKIKPYRLEQQIRLKNSQGDDLYAFWSEKITKYFAERLNEDDNTWINLTSNEYSKMIIRKKLPKVTRVIRPVFKELTHDGYKQIVVYAKKARGMMARFIIQNKIDDVESLKFFDSEGYAFAPQLSKKEEWVFIR